MSRQCEAKLYMHKECAFWRQMATITTCKYAGVETNDGGTFCQRHSFLQDRGLVDYTHADGRRGSYTQAEIEQVAAEERYLAEVSD